MSSARIIRAVLGLCLAPAIAFLSCGRPTQAPSPMDDGGRQVERNELVEGYVVPNGVTDPRILAAVRRVPRHAFVPDGYASMAYVDEPLPIGLGQTISQPSLVAYMVDSLRLRGDEKVLEVGTGSGYQTAILAELIPRVFTIEIVELLAKQARATLTRLGYGNVVVRVGDGYQGWPEEAPFDAIIVTAAPDHVPEPLLEQLAVGGRIVLPVGRLVQHLVLVTRTTDGYRRTNLATVRFVPMTGTAERADHDR